MSGASTRWLLARLMVGLVLLGIAVVLASRDTAAEQQHIRQRAQRALVERSERAVLRALSDASVDALRADGGGNAWYFALGEVPGRLSPADPAGYDEVVRAARRWDVFHGMGRERYPTVGLEHGQLVYDWEAIAAEAVVGIPVVVTIGELEPGAFVLPQASGAVGRPVWARPLVPEPERRGRPWWTFALGALLVGLLIDVVVVIRRRAVAGDRQLLLERMSHDLRTPAATVRSLAGTLRVVEGEDRARFLDLIDEESERLGVGLERMLRAARGDAPLALRPVPVALDDWLAAVRDRWRDRLPELTVESPRPLVAALDPERLDEAVDALLDNARRYGGSEISLRVEGDDREVRIVVEDDGPGIPATDRRRVLKAHQSGRGGGFGLGLWAAGQVAEAHGGRLALAAGSRFVLHLPVSAE